MDSISHTHEISIFNNMDSTILFVDMSYIDSDSDLMEQLIKILKNMNCLQELIITNCFFFDPEFEAVINEHKSIESLEIAYTKPIDGFPDVQHDFLHIESETINSVCIRNAWWHTVSYVEVMKFFSSIVLSTHLSRLELDNSLYTESIIDPQMIKTLCFYLEHLQIDQLTLRNFAYFSSVVNQLCFPDNNMVCKIRFIFTRSIFDSALQREHLLNFSAHNKCIQLDLDGIFGFAGATCDLLNFVIENMRYESLWLGYVHTSVVIHVALKLMQHKLLNRNSDTIIIFSVGMYQIHSCDLQVLKFLARNCKEFIGDTEYALIKHVYKQKKGTSR